MNTYRFLFWSGYIMRDCYIKADSEEEAIKKFAEKRNGKTDNIIKMKKVG